MTRGLETMSKEDIEASLRSALDLMSKEKTAQAKDYSFYWSKKSPAIAAAVYEVFLKKDGVILDPFIGSGSSLYGLKMFKNGHKFIGVDVNQLPIELVHFNMNQMDSTLVNKIVETIRAFILEKQEVYEYQLDSSEQPYVLKKAYINKTESGYEATYFHFEKGKDKFDLTAESGEIFSKAKIEYEKRTNEHLRRNAELPNLVLGKNSRIAIKDGMKMSDIFSPVNFSILSDYRSLSENFQELAIVLSSCLHLCRLTDTGSQSQFPYWVPKVNAVDRNILELLEKKAKELIKFTETSRGLDIPIRAESFTELSNANGSAYLMHHAPVQNLDTFQIPDNSIDLVFTDPPYFDQVAYSEYLVIWEFFTGLATDLENEIIQSNRESFASDRDNYLKLMQDGFKTISDKLKENHLAIIYFKDSKLTNVFDFLRVLQNAQLEYLTQVHVSKPKFTYKQNTSQKSTVEGDSLYVFRKNSSLSEVLPTNESLGKIEAVILQLVDEYLAEHGSSTASKILDNSVIPGLWRSQLLHLITDETVFQKLMNDNYEIDSETRKVIGRL
jgi:DNA modification methylase